MAHGRPRLRSPGPPAIFDACSPSSPPSPARSSVAAPADSGEHPAIALLRTADGPHCGGVLVADDAVLTAAHCAPGVLDVVLDDVDPIDRVGTEVTATTLHPAPWTEADVALLHLAASVSVTPVSPATRPPW